MGEMKHLKCTSCGKEWDINIGHGMMHGKKSFVIKGFSPQAQARVENAIKDEIHPPYGFSQAIATCKKCEEFVGVPTIKTKSASIVDVCPKCAGIVELAPENLQGLKCPSCGGDVEVSKPKGHWD